MRKMIIVGLMVILALAFGGCTAKKESQEPTPNKKKAVESKANNQAMETLESYFQHLVQGKLKAAQRYRVTGQSAGDNQLSVNGQYLGYKIIKSSQSGEKASIEGELFTAIPGEPVFENTRSRYQLTKKDGQYLIERVQLLAKKSLYVKEDSLYLKHYPLGGEVPVINLKNLPYKQIPQGANQEFVVGREGFGTVALSPDYNSVAVSNKGAHGFLGIWDNLNKVMQPLDLYLGSKVSNLAWSGNGHYLAAEITTPDGSRGLEVYDTISSWKQDNQIKDQFPPIQYSISKPFWVDKYRLVFLVRGPGGLANPRPQKNGGNTRSIRVPSNHLRIRLTQFSLEKP